MSIDPERRSAPEIRSFVGARRAGDRGLPSQRQRLGAAARFEMEEAGTAGLVPITLINLARLVALLLEYDEELEPAVAALVPLKRVYWPDG